MGVLFGRVHVILGFYFLFFTNFILKYNTCKMVFKIFNEDFSLNPT